MAETVSVDLSTLSEEQQDIFFAEKLKIFKTTFLLCILYGVIAFVMLFIMLFTEWGKTNLYENAAYFIATYIVGTIIIIGFMVYYIFSFKPTALKTKHDYDTEICPDYWKIENVNSDSFKDSSGNYFFDTQANGNLNMNHFKYKCKMDPNIFSTDNLKMKNSNHYINQQTGGSDLVVELTKQNTGLSDNQFLKMQQYAATMSGYNTNQGLISKQNNQNSIHKIENDTPVYYNVNDTNIPLTCDQVYPVYLSSMDKEYSKNNPSEPSNVFRCAYSKVCKVPWTDAGCSN